MQASPDAFGVHRLHRFPLKCHALRLYEFVGSVNLGEEHPVADVDRSAPLAEEIEGRPPGEFTWERGKSCLL